MAYKCQCAAQLKIPVLVFAVLAVLFAVNMFINCVFYINIPSFFRVYFSYHTTLHTCIANDPAFFDSSQKFDVAFGLSASDACKVKFQQSLSKHLAL